MSIEQTPVDFTPANGRPSIQRVTIGCTRTICLTLVIQLARDTFFYSFHFVNYKIILLFNDV